MLRVTIIALGLVSMGPAALAGTEINQTNIRTIEALELAEAATRARLLRDIQSDDRRTWRVAMAELRGGFSGDSELTAAVLQLIAPEAAATVPASPLSAQSRRNILNILAGVEDAAWTAASVARAQGILANYATAGHFTPGDLEQKVLLSLSERVNGISAASYSFGDIQVRVDEKIQFTDVDIFVCDYAAGDTGIVLQARAFGERLAAGDFGRVRLREAAAELAKAADAIPGSTTIVFDQGHEERRQVEIVARMLNTEDLPKTRLIANTGPSSHWYLSVFVCP